MLVRLVLAGSLFQTASGNEGMLTSVIVGIAYTDPGASAVDESNAQPGVLNDITQRLVVTGVSDVDTSVPTPSNAPFVIT